MKFNRDFISKLRKEFFGDKSWNSTWNSFFIDFSFELIVDIGAPIALVLDNDPRFGVSSDFLIQNIAEDFFRYFVAVRLWSTKTPLSLRTPVRLWTPKNTVHYDCCMQCKFESLNTWKLGNQLKDHLAQIKVSSRSFFLSKPCLFPYCSAEKGLSGDSCYLQWELKTLNNC